MTAPGPVPGSENPFVLGYQTRQFPNDHIGNPDVTALDALADVPSCTIDGEESSGLTGRAADRYDPAVGTPPFVASTLYTSDPV